MEATMPESPEFMKRAGLNAMWHAEDFFNRGFIDMAMSSVNAAKHMNAELSSRVDSFLVAYTVQQSAAIKGKDRWYAVLGVEDVKASVEDIKRQYRKMALSVHPDKNGSVAPEEAFKNVGKAWEILSDEVKRTAYDYKMGYRSAPPKSHQKPFHPQPQAQARRTSSQTLKTQTYSSHQAGAKRRQSPPEANRGVGTSAKRAAINRCAVSMFATAMKLLSDEAIDVTDIKIQFKKKSRCGKAVSHSHCSTNCYTMCAKAMKRMCDEAIDTNDIKVQFAEKIRCGKAY